MSPPGLPGAARTNPGRERDKVTLRNGEAQEHYVTEAREHYLSLKMLTLTVRFCSSGDYDCVHGGSPSRQCGVR